jgi:hypothetical protein
LILVLTGCFGSLYFMYSASPIEAKHSSRRHTQEIFELVMSDSF